MTQPPLHQVVDSLANRMLAWRNDIDYNCANLNGKYLDSIMAEAVATMKSQKEWIEYLEDVIQKNKFKLKGYDEHE